MRHAFAQLLFWSAFYYLMPAISAQLVSSMDWPVLHVSATFTAAFLVWAMFAPIVGTLIDRGRGGVVMFAGGLLGTLTLVFLTTVSDRWVFSGALLVLGTCMAATLYDPCFSLIMRRFDAAAADRKAGARQGAKATAWVTLIAGFATLLTFPLAQWLSHMMPWQQIMLVFAVLSGVAVLLLPAQDRRKQKPVRGEDLLPFRIEWAPAIVALAFGLIMLSHSVVLFLLPVALAQNGQAGTTAMLTVAILGPAQIVGRIVWQVYDGRFAPQTSALALFVVFCLPPVLLLMLGLSTAIVYAALIIQGAGYGVHTILRPVLARLYLPLGHLGKGLGCIATVGLVMMALGPLVGGLIWSQLGFDGLMWSVLSFNIAALGLIALLFQIEPDGGAV